MRAHTRPKFLALGATVASLVLLTGCHVPGFAIQRPADKQGQQAAGLWRGAEFAALVVGVIVWGLIVFVVVRYRRQTSDTVLPSQRAEILPLEIAYTVTPLIIVAVLFGVTTLRQRKIQALSAHPDLTVSATAYQWGWRFGYSGGTAISSQGGIPPELVLPAGQTAEIDLTATDVVHAFFVPAFFFQRNAVPGSPTKFDVTPTEPGVFPGKCSTFCGIGHAQMLFTVRVVTPVQFERWLSTAGPKSP